MKQTTLKRKQQRTEAIKNKVCIYTKDLLHFLKLATENGKL